MADQIPLETQGLQAALADLGASGDLSRARTEAAQPGLFPLSQMEAPETAAEPVAAERGPGRPAGSKNKSTEEWRTFLLSKHSSPLQQLAHYGSMPLLEFWRMLRQPLAGARPTFAELSDCMKLQFAMWKELAPYLHSKQPIAIDGGEHGLINLFIGQGKVEHDADNSHGALNAEFIIMESESDQGLSDDDAEKSNGGESNGEGEAIELQG